MIRVSETTVKLVTPITIALKGGTFDEIDEITIKGPTAGKSQRQNAAALQAMFEKPFAEEIEAAKSAPGYKEAQAKRAVDADEKSKESDENKTMRDYFDPSTVVKTIAKYRDSNVAERDALNVAMTYLESLLITGCGFIAGQPMQPSDIGKISYSDMKTVLGEFVANFLLDSLFD